MTSSSVPQAYSASRLFALILLATMLLVGLFAGRAFAVEPVKISRDDTALDLTASVPGIDPDEFARIAGEAERTCPISRLLDAEITLTHSLR